MRQELHPTIEAVRKQLDAAVEGFDDDIRDRLRAIRLSALSAAHGRQSGLLRGGLRGFGMPFRIAAATGATLLVVLAISLGPLRKDRAAVTDADPMASMELLASAHDVEFYRNLEFIVWYAQTQHDR